ncbi:MAG: addiction module protein [Cellulomonas sp.]|jgi:hypothetical protein|nr:addiction module protein [Cellulomonas sp.]
MASDVAEVERALLALAPRERIAVIQTGLRSLDVADADQTAVDAAWLTEIETRFDDIVTGAVQLGTFEDTYARFAAKYPTQ